MTKFSTPIRYSANDPRFGDGDENDFNLSVSGTFSLVLNVDALGSVTGTSSATIAVSGSTSDDQDGDTDAFSDSGTGSGTIAGSITSGVRTTVNLDDGGSVGFNGQFNASRTAVTGNVTVNDLNLGGLISTPVTIPVTIPVSIPPPLNVTDVLVARTIGLLSGDVYSQAPVGGQQYVPILQKSDGEFQAVAYQNGDQIVIAIRGTDLTGNFIDGLLQGKVSGDNWYGLKNVLTDISSFPTGNPSSGLQRSVLDASQFLAQVVQKYPDANVTLTGHSLGAAIAQLVSQASGYSAATYNAPGAQQLYANLQTQLAPALNLKKTNPNPNPYTNINYHTPGDAVSLFGTPIGTTYSMVPDQTYLSQHPNNADTIWNIVNNHMLDKSILPQLNAPGTVLQPGLVEDGFSVSLTQAIIQAAASSSISNPISTIVHLAGPANTIANWFDPGFGRQFVFSESAGSPLVTAVTFPADVNVSSFVVWMQTANGWTSPQSVSAGKPASFGSGVSAFKFEGVSPNGQLAVLPDGYMFNTTFATSGNYSATVRSLLNIQQYDLDGDGTDDILSRRADGSLETFHVSAGKIASAKLAGQVGPEWQFAGTGDFNDTGTNGVLMRNSKTGALELYGFTNNQITSAQNLGQVGLDWQFAGFSGFAGNGSSDVLMRNGKTSALEVYNINNNKITVAQSMGQVGLNWQFGAFGDFVGDGTSDMIMRDSKTGALEVYDINNNQITSAQSMGQIGLEWQFAGVGEFAGDGLTDLLMRNSKTGAFEIYGISRNQIALSQDMGQAGLDWQVAEIGDFDGDGTSDLLTRNVKTGAFEVYKIVNNHIVTAQNMGQVGAEWTPVGNPSAGGINSGSAGPAAASSAAGIQVQPAEASENVITVDTSTSATMQIDPATLLSLGEMRFIDAAGGYGGDTITAASMPMSGAPDAYGTFRQAAVGSTGGMISSFAATDAADGADRLPVTAVLTVPAGGLNMAEAIVSDATKATLPQTKFSL